MNYKLPFFVLVTGMVVASILPFGMSQVQEDAFMEIDMLQTQVANPFRIQDYQNNDVFTIDTNGQIFPEQHQQVELYYNNLNEIVWDEGYDALPQVFDTSSDHPQVLAQWHIDLGDREFLESGTGKFFGNNFDANMALQVKANHTGGFCSFETEAYTTWGGWGSGNINSLGAGCSGSNCEAIYTIDHDDYQHDLTTDMSEVRFIIYADVTPATECTGRYFDAYLPIHLPPDITVTRVK